MIKRLKILNSPFVSLLLLLLFAEYLAGLWIPYLENPDATKVIRNQAYKRGWPEYISASSPDHGNHIIIITNSQGYGPELQEEQIYGNLLQNKLQKRGSHIIVENWSVPGMRMPEFIILLQKAIEKKPDMIFTLLPVQLVSFGWEAAEVDLQHGSSDLWLLFSDHRIWSKIYNFWVTRKPDIELYLEAFFMYNFNILRSRIHFLDKLRNQLNREQFNIAYGIDRNKGNFLPKANFKKRPRQNKANADVIDRTFNKLIHYQRFSKKAARFIGILHRMQKENPKTDIRLIWQPSALSLVQKESRDNYNRSIKFVLEEMKNKVRNYDFTNQVKTEYFISLGHMDASGHKVMAEKLEKIVIDALY
ncbi:MAG: hypothetical protein ABUK01_03895 [Leptospirales bacterium]